MIHHVLLLTRCNCKQLIRNASSRYPPQVWRMALRRGAKLPVDHSVLTAYAFETREFLHQGEKKIFRRGDHIGFIHLYHER